MYITYKWLLSTTNNETQRQIYLLKRCNSFDDLMIHEYLISRATPALNVALRKILGVRHIFYFVHLLYMAVYVP